MVIDEDENFKNVAVKDIHSKHGFGDMLWCEESKRFENAVVNKEYSSPTQHGGFFGKVYRMHHGALNTGDDITILGIDKLIGYTGIYNNIGVYKGYTEDGVKAIRLLS